jgi:hypothetical protein
MISALDYLDNDVSHLLSVYISNRRQSNNVLEELNRLIDVNICAKYLKSFDFDKTIRHTSHDEQPRLQQMRLMIAEDILNNERQTQWLYNWPTKLPSFHPKPRSNHKKDTIRRLSNTDAVIDGTGWRLKRFPPDKNSNQIDTLKLIKKKRNKNLIVY